MIGKMKKKQMIKIMLIMRRMKKYKITKYRKKRTS
jgi:hypothetical protein